ncbi:MAG: GGDEF domain-containing protein [Gammaproteobacteria bacterium]|nr:GGDEF domain-containing protein [Gammaproteobacteria bacterium]
MSESQDSGSMTAQFRATLIMNSLPKKEPLIKVLWRRVCEFAAGVWSTTSFEDSKVSEYARELMLEETRRGIMAMAALSALTQLAAMLLHFRLGADGNFYYTYGLLALLSLHIVVSSRFVNEIKSLHLLGTILLVITGVAIMAIAHRTGSVNAALLASVVLLFMVMPIAPWGLREAVVVVSLIYLVFTASSISVYGKFEPEMLWTLQFLMLASAIIATLTIMRNAAVRRDDIKSRFDLESARKRLQLISTRDPLTGAWNRRYLEQNFISIAHEAREHGEALHLAIMDVDGFKLINDTHGHHYGDAILCRLVDVLTENLAGTAHVIRLGGDEFAVLDTARDFESAIERCLKHLATDPKLIEITGDPVEVSAGFSTVSPDETADLDTIYRAADAALYVQKRERKAGSDDPLRPGESMH